ncbi:MAG: DUF559 domain-containing protein [Nostocoides sp.]
MPFDPNLVLPGRPFTRTAALANGLTARDLGGPDYRRIHRGVYIAAHVPDTVVVRARAARLLLPADGAFSHWTAARLWAPSFAAVSTIHAALSRDAYVRADGVRVHRFTYSLERRWRHGLCVTSAEQTFVHLAVSLDLVELVALGDTLVRRQATSPGRLRRYTRAWEGHGGRAAREAAEYVRKRVDSNPESRLRMLVVLGGLPEPVVNHEIRWPDGTLRFKLDLASPEIKLAIEYDGRWHDRPEHALRDEQRRAQLRVEGWTFIIVRAEGLYDDPDTTLAEIVAARVRLGAHVPTRLSDRYRRYFLPSLALAQ